MNLVLTNKPKKKTKIIYSLHYCKKNLKRKTWTVYINCSNIDNICKYYLELIANPLYSENYIFKITKSIIDTHEIPLKKEEMFLLKIKHGM